MVQSSQSRWMLYGANGFTGELCAAEAARRGEKPILAGRRADAVRAIAERHGFEWRAFSLDDEAGLASGLEGVQAVLLAAGPFSHTSAPVLAACLNARVHYLDVTGEISVFDACRERGDEAVRMGISVIPGVGFDVVPSDCLAASTAAALPGARSLELAFFAGGSMSRGTAKTAIEHIHEGSVVRRHGKYQPIAPGSLTRRVDFGGKMRTAVAIPWGDVATAYYSTRIPNITVYMAGGEWLPQALRATAFLSPVLRKRAVRSALQKVVDRFVTGPDEATRERSSSHLWARVEDEAGVAVEGTLVAAEGYRLTAMTSVDATVRVLAGETRPGFHTPSRAFGADYITKFPGCQLRVGV